MNKMSIAAVALSAVLVLGGCGGKDSKSPEALLESGQYEAAANAYLELIKNDEKNADLYIGVADAYLGQGEYEAAVDILCDGFDSTEDKSLIEKMVEVTSDLYKTASEKADYQTVLYCCDRVLECGDSAEIYEISAMCYLYMEQNDKAISAAKTGFEKTSDNSILENVASQLYTMGSKAYTAGDKATALTYFKSVLEIDSENADAANMIKAIGDNPQDSSDTKEDKASDNKDNNKPDSTTKENKQPEQNTTTQQNKPEEEKTSSNNTVRSEPTKTYTVQIGAYGAKENADSKVAKANAAGFSASHYQSGGLYHVTIGTFSTQAEAESYVERAKAAGFDAIII